MIALSPDVKAALDAVAEVLAPLSDEDKVAVALELARPLFEGARDAGKLARPLAQILGAGSAIVTVTRGNEFYYSAGRKPKDVPPHMGNFLDELEAAIERVMEKHKVGRHAPSGRASGPRAVQERRTRR